MNTAPLIGSMVLDEKSTITLSAAAAMVISTWRMASKVQRFLDWQKANAQLLRSHDQLLRSHDQQLKGLEDKADVFETRFTQIEGRMDELRRPPGHHVKRRDP